MHSIVIFRKYFSDETHRVLSSTAPGRYKKLACMNLLDSLSYVLNPNNQLNPGNRDTAGRFSMLMRQFASQAWESPEDPERICLIHLQKALSYQVDRFSEQFTPLREWVDHRYRKLREGECIPLSSVAPLWEVIKDRWPFLKQWRRSAFIQTPNNQIHHWDLTFDKLFYNFRNILVHNTSSKLLNWQKSLEKDPFPDHDELIYPYYSYHDSHWQLFFPLGFFRNLIDFSLQSIEQYLYSHQVDPFDFYRSDERLKGYFLQF
jgi:hypothetical protein